MAVKKTKPLAVSKADAEVAIETLKNAGADFMITMPNGHTALNGCFVASTPDPSSDSISGNRVNTGKIESSNALDFTNPHPPARPLEVQIGGNHYKHYAIQPVEFLERNRGTLGYCQENIIKYTCRLGLKGNTEGTMTDLAKIRHYLDLYEELNGVPKAP